MIYICFIMKIGSLVVCVDASGLNSLVKPLIKGKIYTVREIKNNHRYNPFFGVERIDGIVVYLDEIVNSIHLGLNDEIGYKSERFREIDTPTEIKLEEILELELV